MDCPVATPPPNCTYVLYSLQLHTPANADGLLHSFLIHDVVEGLEYGDGIFAVVHVRDLLSGLRVSIVRPPSHTSL